MRRLRRPTALCVVVLSWVCVLGAGVSLLEAQEIRPPKSLVTIRHLDRIVRPSGEEVDCEILTPDPEVGKKLRVKIRTVTTDVAAGEITAITLRQTAEQVYKNWTTWLRRESRQGSGQLKTDRQRAQAELSLARWCALPHPQLDGEAPNASAAHDHLVRAAHIDGTVLEVWPPLLASFSMRNTVERSDLSALNEEVSLYLSAKQNGFEHPDIDFRIGKILLTRLDLAERSLAYLSRVLREPQEGGSRNRGQRREARSLLSRTYVTLGRFDDALALYNDEIVNDPTGEDSFVALWESSDILLRIGGAENIALAKERLAKASIAQPDFTEISLRLAAIEYAAGNYKEAQKSLKAYVDSVGGIEAAEAQAARVDLALVDIALGKFERAQKALTAVVGGSTAPEVIARAHLGLGSIEELRGSSETAVAAYEQALANDPKNVVAKLAVASGRVRQGRLDEASQFVAELFKEHGDSRAVFGACSRLQALVYAINGDLEKSAARFEFAADTRPDDPAVLEAAGLVLLRQGKIERGFGYLTRAHALDPKRTATLNGLAYYHYQQGNRVESSKLFDASLTELKNAATKGAAAAAARKEREYSTVARAMIRDLELLEVWIDEFEASTGGLVDGWEEIELFGVEVSSKGGRVVMAGEQQQSPDGETGIRLLRKYRSSDVERASVRLRIDSGSVVPLLRMGGPQGTRSSLAAVEVYRDEDGKVKFRARDSRGEWKVPKISSDETTTDDSLVYKGGMPWPEDSAFHTLEIRRPTGKRQSRKSNSFDVFFDDQPVALNVVVPGLSTAYEFGIYARTNALGNAYSVTIDNFKVFRLNSSARRKN